MRAEIVIGGTAFLVAAWIVSLRLWPYTSCRWCDGSGRRGSRKSYGRCLFCKGKPERLKFGARQVNRRLK